MVRMSVVVVVAFGKLDALGSSRLAALVLPALVQAQAEAQASVFVAVELRSLASMGE